ncbi:hypothetical protein NQ314_021454 [Rhamnusium bicolor]|uniref:Glucose-methanol-choline oxidoreductase N-terminal domain-containing protein n=1 Tax=Rhamnusium bicolor TaxID=1586634 RepID=A0AAV8WI48_9CUCU|nr:hypothetical protein NQ314_021454 [Rhamnusium bicolor]
MGTVNEVCLIPRGRGIGGTTLINGAMYSRGHPTDFDKWAELAGDPSWSYENVLTYFKKSEDFHQTDPDAPVNWGVSWNWWVLVCGAPQPTYIIETYFFGGK